MSRVMLLLSACAVLAALSSVRPAHAVEKRSLYKEQLAYEITVTAPGSKSQGWHGTLYDENGHAMQVAVGKTVMTEIGELVSVAAVDGEPWKPYGMIPATPGMETIILPDPWTYKLYKASIGSKCPSWRGQLLRGAAVVKPQTGSDEMQTSMGPFIWLKGSHGWAHKSWNVKVKVVKCG